MRTPLVGLTAKRPLVNLMAFDQSVQHAGIVGLEGVFGRRKTSCEGWHRHPAIRALIIDRAQSRISSWQETAGMLKIAAASVGGGLEVVSTISQAEETAAHEHEVARCHGISPRSCCFFFFHHGRCRGYDSGELV